MLWKHTTGFWVIAAPKSWVYIYIYMIFKHDGLETTKGLFLLLWFKIHSQSLEHLLTDCAKFSLRLQSPHQSKEFIFHYEHFSQLFVVGLLLKHSQNVSSLGLNYACTPWILH